LALFAAFGGAADAKGSVVDLSIVTGVAVVYGDLPGSDPDPVDSAPRPHKFSKQRLRESLVPAKPQIDAEREHESDARACPSLSSSADLGLVRSEVFATVISAPASPRLQLKLQLGQAP